MNKRLGINKAAVYFIEIAIPTIIGNTSKYLISFLDFEYKIVTIKKNSVTKNLKEQAHLIRIAHNVMSDKRLKKIAYDFFYDFYFFMDEEVRNIIKSKKKVR